MKEGEMKLNKASKLVISVSVIGWALIVLILFNVVEISAANDSKQATVFQKIKLFNEVLFKLQENYVEDLDINELIDAAIAGLMEKTDPHTVYFTPDEFDRFSSNTKGEFGGLGISIDKKGDYITVVSPIEGTPAYRMGIQPGDKIAKVDGESMVGVSTDEVIKKMRGDKGTKVVLSILRPGIEEELEFVIIRDIIKIDSIPYAFKLDSGVGYIRVRQFNANTTRELKENLDELEEQNIRGLVIDLRYNPGGLLREAVDTVNEFIGKGKLVVYTKGRIPQANAEYITRYNRMRSGYPVIVLINEASASASEIFAGSLQDWDKALIVGNTSFGKGSVQRLYPLTDGNGLKVTTAKYYINSGRCIHRDLNDELLKDERVLNGEIDQEEYKHMIEEADEENMKEVFYTAVGRVVYGGGGITPDIEIEQHRLSPLSVELRRQNTFFNFSIDYNLAHDADITPDFYSDDVVVEEFFDYARDLSIEIEDTEVDSSLAFIQNEITYNIVSRKYGMEEGYKVLIHEDYQLQQALAIFDEHSSLEEMFDYAEEQKLVKKN